MVVGHARAGSGTSALFYGHYDVQPADPLELWESPPFEPVIRPAQGEIGERIVARGAVDDKGQVMMFIEALRAWKAATGKVAGGARFTVLLEGEEESGSVNLEAWVKARTEMLSRCKVCLISDTGMLGAIARDHLRRARAELHGSGAPRPQPGPALRALGRPRAESDQRTHQSARPAVGRRPSRDDPGLL